MQWQRLRQTRDKPAAGASRIGRAAGGQDYEVHCEARKTNKSAGAVKRAVQKVGSSRKRIERRLGRQEWPGWRLY